MKKAIKILIILIIVAVLALAAAFLVQYGENFGIYLKKPTPQAYVEKAVSFMDTQGIYAETDEWQTVKAETLEQAQDVDSYEASYEMLEAAIKVAGGKHSKFIKPGEVTDAADGLVTEDQVPECTMREDGILQIRLPEFTGDKKAGQAYVDAVYGGIREHAGEIKGVIIDLRGNTGGDMGPMVAAVSAFLEDGELMYFEIQGVTKAVTLEDGCVSGGGSTVSVDDPIKVKDVPIAILQDGMTASSGEATLLCFRGMENVKTFGADSAGYCSCNNLFKLADGAKLQLTVGPDVARTGEKFCESPISPDVATSDSEAAATAWLLG